MARLPLSADELAAIAADVEADIADEAERPEPPPCDPGARLEDAPTGFQAPSSRMDPDDVLLLARQLASELRHLRGAWLRRQLGDAEDPLGPPLARADALAAKLEDAGQGVAGPAWAVFGARLAITGDPGRAAAAIGRGKVWAKRRLLENPEIQRAAADDVPHGGDWTDLHAEAKRAVAIAMRFGEHKDALKAAEMVIERVEGKVPQRVDKRVLRLDISRLVRHLPHEAVGRIARGEPLIEVLASVAAPTLTRALSAAEADEGAVGAVEVGVGAPPDAADAESADAELVGADELDDL